MTFNRILYLLFLLISFSSCLRKPILELQLSEEIKPMSAFSATLMVHNPYNSKLKINTLRNDFSLYFYLYNKEKKNWKKVMIGHSIYVMDQSWHVVDREYLLPNDTLNLKLELTPYELLNENQEYILRAIYYVGSRNLIYSEPFKIEGNIFKDISDCLILDNTILVKELKQVDKLAMESLKSICPEYNLSIANPAFKKKKDNLLSFIEEHKNSSYIIRAKLVYSKWVHSNDKNRKRIENSISFLEELLHEKTMDHHKEWILIKLRSLRK